MQSVLVFLKKHFNVLIGFVVGLLIAAILHAPLLWVFLAVVLGVALWYAKDTVVINAEE